jgi:8-amino-7-oxononanoate synthase
VDFCSNDYLGLSSRLKDIPYEAVNTGSGGSRLLAGNYPAIEELEKSIASFHDAEAGLIFNSGYDANLGLISCIALKGDTILYDQLIHASLRDGIRLGYAQALSFDHNDPASLENRLKQTTGNVYVITESLFSMDGDLAPLQVIAELCEQFGARLIVDEAHATGIIGDRGEGLVQQLQLQSKCFARIHTFGKALGVHGAIVLCSNILRSYLINFSRPFIYTTALPPTTIQHITESYKLFPGMHSERKNITQLIACFKSKSCDFETCKSDTAIQGIVIPGNQAAVDAAAKLQAGGLDVRAIRYPTVQPGKERLRVILHAFNTIEQVDKLFDILKT